MSLIVKDTIKVESSNGIQEIQLCFGNYTKIEKADSVDVLVCSTTPGYDSTCGTLVIDALNKDSQIDVQQLAKEKEEDLPKAFSCWWSKKLSNAAHFEQLLCFEGGSSTGTKPSVVVSQIFRSLVTKCKDKNFTVMMPLLGAGEQHSSKSLMLRLIVNAATHWMQAGLQLKTLKILIYSSDPGKENLDQNPLSSYFKELKSKWLEEAYDFGLTITTEHKYDVYLSYSDFDKKCAEMVIENLKKKKQDIRIFSERQDLDDDESFQDRLYKTIISCTRVITLLSPDYLEDPSCIEQYNIGLCNSILRKQANLAPFYIKTIEKMPTYMDLVQYFECRPISNETILPACEKFIKWLEKYLSKEEKNSEEKIERGAFDVLLSYAHRDVELANRVMKQMKDHHPDWKYFVDTEVLTFGDAWQNKLYECIESSKVVLALISQNYLDSIVCQEEFNLAYGLHSDRVYVTRLLPVQVEKIPNLPAWCEDCRPIEAFDIGNGTMLDMIERIIASYLPYDEKDLQSPNKSIIEACSTWRSFHQRSQYPFLPCINVPSEGIGTRKKSSVPKEVVVGYSPKEASGAGIYLCRELEQSRINIRVNAPEEDGSCSFRFKAIDSASLVVFAIDRSFILEPDNMAELSTALARQRNSDELIIFPIFVGDVMDIPPGNAFIHLLWSCFATSDKCWRDANMDDDETPEKRCMDAAISAIERLLTSENGMSGKHRTLLSLDELQKSFPAMESRTVDQLDFNPLLYKRHTSTDDNAVYTTSASLSGIEEAFKRKNQKATY